MSEMFAKKKIKQITWIVVLEQKSTEFCNNAITKVTNTEVYTFITRSIKYDKNLLPLDKHPVTHLLN